MMQLETFNAVRLNMAEARRHQREARYSTAVSTHHAHCCNTSGRQGAVQALLYGQTVMHSNWVMDAVALVARCALPEQHH